MNQELESLWQPANDAVVSDHENDIVLYVNGQPLIAKPSDTVATALLRAGHTHFGVHAKTGRPVAASCMMGVCFGCLCTIDGRPGSQACLEPVRDGLIINTEADD